MQAQWESFRVATLGQLPGATAAYQRSLQLNPKLSRAWYSAGCAESSPEEYAGATDSVGDFIPVGQKLNTILDKSFSS